MWKFNSSKKEVSKTSLSVGASVILTNNLGNLHWSLGQVRIGIIERQSSCDAGVWHTQGPHFPPKQEEQEQGYPSTISSTAVKP